jgi:ComF family protein
MMAPADMPQWVQKLMPLGQMLADALLPPRCLATGEVVDKQGQLSARAWRDINFITSPMCRRCGMPFAFGFEADAELECGACIANPPEYDRARAVFHYDDASRSMILAFKHGDRMEGAPAFAAWMARAGADFLAEADMIVPVPLHRRRLFRRRYNQSAVLARFLARLGGKPAAMDTLIRTRHTPRMGGLNREERLRNLRGAIAVRDSRRAGLAGGKILLIDDVLTTGATAMACARALRGAGAARVDILTLARVVRPG